MVTYEAENAPFDAANSNPVKLVSPSGVNFGQFGERISKLKKGKEKNYANPSFKIKFQTLKRQVVFGDTACPGIKVGVKAALRYTVIR